MNRPSDTSKSFLQTTYRLPKDVALFLRDLVAGLHMHTQHIFFHIVVCSLQKPWDGGWVPVENGLIRRSASQSRWKALAENNLIEETDFNRYTHRCREYRPTPAVMDQVVAMLAADINRQEDWYDLMTGKPSCRKASTRRTKGNNRIGMGGPLEDGLEAYASMRTPYNKPAVLDHLQRLEAAATDARLRFEATGDDAFTTEYQRAIRDNDGIRPVVFEGQRYTPAYQELLSAKARYRNDLNCFTWVLSQETGPAGTLGDGFYWYQPAYTVQMSGRVAHVGGGLQSCSREMKEAAYAGVPGLRNYDLKSSQPRILLQRLLEVPEEHRPDTSWIEAYLADPGAKYRFSQRAGVSVDTWKSALCAVMMGASLPKQWDGSKGEVARLVGMDHPGNENHVYQQLRAQLAELHGEIQRWHDYLIDHKLKTEAFSSRGGRMIRNESGRRLALSDLDKRRYRRRGQVAAFYLQGLEAAFIHTLAGLENEFGYRVLANEHDGLVTLGEIPAEAVARAAASSGLLDPVLEEKLFVGRAVAANTTMTDGQTDWVTTAPTVPVYSSATSSADLVAPSPGRDEHPDSFWHGFMSPDEYYDAVRVSSSQG
jgi:hypothetical protein